MGTQDMDLGAVLLAFDPVALDADGLYEAALTYARQLEGDTDADALRREIKSAVLELGLSYETLRSAREGAQRSAAQAEEAAQAYARGRRTRAPCTAPGAPRMSPSPPSTRRRGLRPPGQRPQHPLRRLGGPGVRLDGGHLRGPVPE